MLFRGGRDCLTNIFILTLGIKLYSAAASTTEGRPVVCGGGMINYSNREKCYAFDPSTSGWVPFASMPEPRTLMEAVSVGDEGDFIVIGGKDC